MNELEYEQLLDTEVAACYDDPLRFAEALFDWKSLTPESWRKQGRVAELRQWQRDYLSLLGQEVRRRGFDGMTPVMPIMFTTRSGHGVGKTFMVAVLVFWVMATRPKCRISITANTADQLKAKTWAELGKAKDACLVGHWFNLHSSKGNLVLAVKDGKRDNEKLSGQWFARGFSPAEHNSEAFAGQHAADSSSVYIFDEASGVPEIFFDVMRGGLTDGEPMVFCFGNPTRNSGAFYLQHTQPGETWTTFHISSLKVENVNQTLLDTYRNEYGVNSDFWRVRVRGEFPEVGNRQFFETTVVDDCHSRADIPGTGGLVFGVDVARFGTSHTVIYPRRGRDARNAGEIEVIPNIKPRDLAFRLAERITRERPYKVYIDGSGIGIGTIDELVSQGFGDLVVAVNGASSSPKPYLMNMRAYCYYQLREAMRSDFFCLPRLRPGDGDIGQRVRRELLAQEKHYRQSDEALGLVRKDELVKLTGASCDVSDALSLTYAGPATDDAARTPNWDAMHLPAVARQKVSRLFQ